MKKMFRVIPAIILSVFLLSSFSFVYADEVVTDDKTVTGIKLVIDEKNRFVKIGESPDFSQAQISVTYYDGSTATLPYDEKYLTDWQKDQKGRCFAKFNVDGSEFTEYFIVYDESISVLDFQDVYKKYWGYKQIQQCVRAGFFVGVSKTQFGISNNMTRAQFCQMIYQIYKNDETVITRHKQAVFSDVNAGVWYYEAVTACAESEIVSGMGDGTFSPNSPISRQDVAVIMMRILLGTTGADNVDIEAALKDAREQKGIKAADFDLTSNYAKKYVVSALGVIYYGDENGNINPTKNITRTECAAMINNLFFKGFVDENAEKKLVYLSPSNQNSNQYAIYDKKSHPEYTEGLQMQKVGDRVAELLIEMGYDVYIADIDLSIRGEENSRAAEAKRLGADCYVAIHSNGAPSKNDGSYQGTTCFYNGNNKGAKELSDFIYNRLSALTPTKDRGSLNDMLTNVPFTEVKNPTMANVLIEVEYHDYAQYATWIVNNIDKIAEAIALGIDDYLKTL